MKNLKETNHTKKGLILATVLLLCLSVVGNSGLISVEHYESMTFFERFGESPIDRVRVEANYTRIAFSAHKKTTFLERFDDTDMNENNWTYYECGANLSDARPWVGASNLLLVTAADGANYTKCQYSIPAKSSTGLKPGTSGIIVNARVGEAHGTPVGGLEMTTGTYYVRVFFDGSGNIDITYHASSSGTLTTVNDAVASATADKWYTFQIELYSSTAKVKIFNETGGQLGSTETLSTYMTYSSFRNLTIWANTTAAATKMLAFDWIYATGRATERDYTEVELLSKTKDTAGDEKEVSKTTFSYSDSGIENDTGSALSRDIYNFTEVLPGEFSQRNYNDTEFRELLSTVEEYDNDVEATQTYYAKGWNDLKEDMEDSLDARIEKITGDSCWVVDYVVLDLNTTTIYSDSYVNLVEDWFKDEAIDIILEEDPDAEVELHDGTTKSLSTMPKAEMGAFLCGEYTGLGWNPFEKPASRVSKVVFSTSDMATDVAIAVSKAYRGKISTASGLIQGSVSDAVDSSKSWVGTTSGKAEDMLDTYVVAPTTGIGAKLGSGVSTITSKLSKVSNTLRKAIDTSAKTISGTIRGLASLPATISAKIGASYDGIKSAFMNMGKAIKDNGLSMFNLVGDTMQKVKTFLIYGLVFVAIIALVYFAFKSGMFSGAVNKGAGVAPK